MSDSRRRHKFLRYDEKSLIVRTLLESDLSIPDIASEYKIGESTVRDWLQRIDYDVANLERLRRVRISRLERTRPIVTDLPAWVQQEILEKVKSHPMIGALKLKQHFFRHHQTVLSEKKIYFFLKEQGIIAARLKDKNKKKPEASRRFEYPHPLAAVQLDLLTVTLANRSKLYLITFLDDYSRYILHSEFVREKTMDNVIRALTKTVKLHGIMDSLICDKGSEFVSWQSFTKFEETLCHLDIELIASGPETPQCQGKIERWHQSYRQECERVVGGFESYSQAKVATDRYINYYNFERVHQGIGGLVPADRFYGVADDLKRELSQYHKDNHEKKCIYFTCNINGTRLVVSGPRNGALTIYNSKDQDLNEKEFGA